MQPMSERGEEQQPQPDVYQPLSMEGRSGLMEPIQPWACIHSQTTRAPSSPAADVLPEAADGAVGRAPWAAGQHVHGRRRQRHPLAELDAVSERDALQPDRRAGQDCRCAGLRRPLRLAARYGGSRPARAHDSLRRPARAHRLRARLAPVGSDLLAALPRHASRSSTTRAPATGGSAEPGQPDGARLAGAAGRAAGLAPLIGGAQVKRQPTGQYSLPARATVAIVVADNRTPTARADARSPSTLLRLPAATAGPAT